MRKIVIFMLVGLLGVAVLGPAAAKKKKPKKPAAPVPVELQYFLRAPESCTTDSFLSLTDGTDADCVYVDSATNAVATAAGLDAWMHYPAVDGLPLTLDTARKVVATIATRGANGTGAGPTSFEFVLVGTVAGEEKELARHTESGTFGPGEIKTMEFEMTLDPALAGAILEGLRLDVYVEGPALVGRGIEHDEPVSSIKVPALK